MSDARPRTDKPLFDRLIEEYAAAKAYREQKVEPRWRAAIQLALPMYGEYGSDTEWPDRRFDATATECITIVADAMYGKVCSSAINWFVYELVDEQQNRDSQYREVAEALTEHMRTVFSISTFYDIAAEWLGLYVGLGLAPMDIQEDVAEGRIINRVDNPRGIYLVANSRNRIDTCYQRVWLTVDQAVDKWTEENLDREFLQQFSHASSAQLYEFLNVIKPRSAYDPNSLVKTKMPFASYWLRPGNPKKEIIEESGYRVFPKAIPRWKTRGNDPYPWSLIDDVLPDVRTLNDMAAANILAAQKTADPAKWFPREHKEWSDNPGVTNYYTDPVRQPKYAAPAGNYRFNDKLFEMLRERVRQGMKVNHFLMLRPEEKGDRTAREVLEIKKEQATVTGGPVSKAETEGLDGVHARMLQIEADSGRLNKIVPPELLAGLKMRVKYLGPLSQLQREVQTEEEIVGAIESAWPMVQAFPQTIHMIKRPELVVERILRAKHFPNENIASPRDYAKALQVEAEKARAIQEQMENQELARGIDPNKRPDAGSPAKAALEQRAAG